MVRKQSAWGLQKPLLEYRAPAFIAALCDLGSRERLTRAELARRTRINSTTITEWMRGSGPKYEHVEMVAQRGFGIASDELIRIGQELVERFRREERRKELASVLARRAAEPIIERSEELRKEDPRVWRAVAEYYAERLREETDDAGDGGIHPAGSWVSPPELTANA